MEKDIGSEDSAAKVEIFDAISHPARIKILQALDEKPTGFAELGRAVGIESGGHLSFHLTKLRHLVSTNSYGEYVLTSKGKEALLTIRGPREKAPAQEVASSRANRVAILPLTSMSPDPNDEYFAEGMHEEIISTVSEISGLDVISRTSVMGYKGTNKKVEEIGRELNVGSVLEGSFRKVGSRIRVTVQFIELAGDRHLWGKNYERNLDDVFEVQTDIAKQIADALRASVPSPENERTRRKPTESSVAYTLYLKGRYLWNRRGGRGGEENVVKAVECFEQSVKEDPNFALGYVGKADCFLTLGGENLPSRSAAHENAKAMVVKALELDPELAEAHATKGLVLMDEYRFREAEEEFRRAIELKPNYALAHQWYSYIFFHQKRWEEALGENERAAELDPLSPETVFNQAHMYFHMKDYGKALELWRRVAALDPSYAGAYFMMAQVYMEMKMPEDTEREITKYAELVRSSSPLVGLEVEFVTAAAKNDREKMRKVAFEVEARHREAGLGAVNMALTFFAISEIDKGFEWLEQAYSLKEPAMLELKCAHQFDGVRDDPRFLDLLKRVGLD